MVGIISTTFRSFGFEMLETPVIENEETLSGKYGPEGDMKRFRLVMKHKQAAGLRYDHTVPLARFMAMHWNKFPLPYRRFAIGPVFRNESPSAARLRQFTQCDFDTVGTRSPIVDAEIVAMNYEVLNKLGFSGAYTVMINDRRLLNAMVLHLGVADTGDGLAILRAWDKLEKVSLQQAFEQLVEELVIQHTAGVFPSPSDDQIQRLKRSTRSRLETTFLSATEKLLDMKEAPSSRLVDEMMAKFQDQKVHQALEDILTLLQYIDSMGVPSNCYQFNPLMARGLDYYTGPIFETYVKVGGVGSITGGGRFDNLIQQMGGPNMPASGSSFGLERLQEVMRQLGIGIKSTSRPDVLVAIFDISNTTLVQQTFSVASDLRLTGLKVEVYTGDTRGLGKQFQVANSKKIPFVVVVGPDELRNNEVTLKDMGTGHQVSVARRSLVEYLTAALQTTE